MEMLDGASYNPKWKGNAEKYLEAKLKVIYDGFKVTPTEREMEHLKSLKTQAQIDNAILTIVDRKYGWN